jgi:hypothetical protein
MLLLSQPQQRDQSVCASLCQPGSFLHVFGAQACRLGGRAREVQQQVPFRPSDVQGFQTMFDEGVRDGGHPKLDDVVPDDFGVTPYLELGVRIESQLEEMQ